MRASLAVL
ncbi:hypothetical protein A2U01_0108651, partial [Trifolium medium]|nr:hypothetical protein [Trifolium medium]